MMWRIWAKIARSRGQNLLVVLLLAPALYLFSIMGTNAAPTLVWPQRGAVKLPAGAWRDAVLYGRKLVNETYNVMGPEVSNKALRFAGNNLACQNCHLSGGTRKYSLPFIGIYGSFPAYMARENAVQTLEDRIEGCLERSMNGRALPPQGKEMTALVAYIKFLSSDIPVGQSLEGRGSPTLQFMTRAADPNHGSAVYATRCASCHQAGGQGVRKGVTGDARGYTYPPLWGPDSFNDGAGMHRLIAAASFIHANMPLGANYKMPRISAQDAWDVAAFVNSRPRPKRAHLEADYPDRRRKPVDAPFPPFADKFSLEQHRVGPFQPIVNVQTALTKAIH